MVKPCMGQDPIQPSSDRREMLIGARRNLQAAREVSGRVEERGCPVKGMDDVIDRTALILVSGRMSGTEIEPFAGLHFRAFVAVAVSLEGGDERIAEVKSDATELLVDPDFAGDDERTGGRRDDPVDRMRVGTDQTGDVFLELEGRPRAGQMH